MFVSENRTKQQLLKPIIMKLKAVLFAAAIFGASFFVTSTSNDDTNKDEIQKQAVDKSQRSEFLLLGSLIALSIAFSPYLFYLYEIFPSGPVWETSFFTYESKYYENVLTAAWTYLGKITPLISSY